MSNMNVSLEMAELRGRFPLTRRGRIRSAGEEGGYPPKKDVDAFHYIQRENFNITVHAGEGFGKESIWQAIQYCGAHRIGHGTRKRNAFIESILGEIAQAAQMIGDAVVRNIVEHWTERRDAIPHTP